MDWESKEWCYVLVCVPAGRGASAEEGQMKPKQRESKHVREETQETEEGGSQRKDSGNLKEGTRNFGFRKKGLFYTFAPCLGSVLCKNRDIIKPQI